jgi:hypothetical protein
MLPCIYGSLEVKRVEENGSCDQDGIDVFVREQFAAAAIRFGALRARRLGPGKVDAIRISVTDCGEARADSLSPCACPRSGRVRPCR